ncbi:MAG: transaldolase [Candidatus Aenigmarchaeota archaeon]|nr:transaldolase [Candidatus Aenigmarchaeota archaeon]
MKIFIDTGSLEEIEEAYSSGIMDGITTNPSLMKKAVEELKKSGQMLDMEDYIKRILKAARGTPVSLEVTSSDYEGMVKEGIVLFKKFNPVAGNVVIKVPCNTSIEGQNRHFDGLKAIKALSSEGIPVNCTLIFTPEQALLAAKAGAKMVSPFAGRIDDFIRLKNSMHFGKSDYFPVQGIEKDGKKLEDNGVTSGIDLVAQCAEIFRYYGINAEVLAASIRNTRQLRDASLAGADIATAPLEVIKAAMRHPKTVEGVKVFSADVVPEYAAMGNGK